MVKNTVVGISYVGSCTSIAVALEDTWTGIGIESLIPESFVGKLFICKYLHLFESFSRVLL